MEAYFKTLSQQLLNTLQTQESLTLSLSAEESLFTRINGAQVRQTGCVEDAAMEMALSDGQRIASGSLTLTRDQHQDSAQLTTELQRLREELAQLPEDPYIVPPATDQHSQTRRHGDLLPPNIAVTQLIPPMSGVDLVGLLASGRQYRGHANSNGSRHWFENDNFVFDYSLVNPQERMVKVSFAGTDWRQADYQTVLAESIERLALLDRPSIRIQPGQYRTYIAAAGVSDLLDMFSWHGLSEAELQTGQSAFGRMRHEGVTLSPQFSLAEDFSTGLVPRFNDVGEVAPERIELIQNGELRHTLVSSRTAQEFGVDSNFAADGEYLRAPVMAGGNLDERDVLKALDTGVYLSNLHYLNWSDVPGGRITGMTRYACFWVENGEILAPIENMRFDESFYHFFGDHLENVTRQTHINPKTGTYGHRSLGANICPGILLNAFTYTL